MNKKAITIVTSVLLASSILMTGCGKEKPQVPQQKQQQKQEAKVETKEAQGDSLQQTVDNQLKEISNLKEEVNYYKRYVQDITKTLPVEKQQLLLNKEWVYSLGVNKINFPNTGVMEIGDNSFDLIFAEEKSKYPVMPDDLSQKVKLPNKLDTYVAVDKGSFNVTPNEKTDGNVHSMVYSFKDVPSGSIVKLTVTEELKAKLGLTTNQLEIRIK